MEITLKSWLADPLLDVMNFLNEVVLRYPEAVSFAPGRPSERFFDVERSLGRGGALGRGARAAPPASPSARSGTTSGSTTRPTASSTT